MSALTFSLAICLTSVLAGFLGALTGLGGGVVIVPVLCLLFRIDLHYAIGASLVSVIATSSGAAAAYVREGFSNIRIGMFLEVATTLGALLGAYLVAKVSSGWIGVIFGVVLLYSAWASMRQGDHAPKPHSTESLGARLRLSGSFPSQSGGVEEYVADRVAGGFGVMFVAGTLSGLLGIGSGAAESAGYGPGKRGCGCCSKVSTTTSNFMIGVTAGGQRRSLPEPGYLPELAMPVTLGVLAGSMAGSRVLVNARVKTLRAVFAVAIGSLGAEMIYSGITGRL